MNKKLKKGNLHDFSDTLYRGQSLLKAALSLSAMSSLVFLVRKRGIFLSFTRTCLKPEISISLTTALPGHYSILPFSGQWSQNSVYKEI